MSLVVGCFVISVLQSLSLEETFSFFFLGFFFFTNPLFKKVRKL